jgi:mannose-6-phosphate isomerase-like protein (cupin superfamily)
MNDEYGENRQIVRTANAQFDTYDFEGPVQEDMSLLKLSYDRTTGQGAYMIRMEAGAETVRHVHKRREEYLIIEGDLVESDGTVLGPGDYVIYQPGTEHNSRTVNGCLLIGIDYSLS